MMASYKASTDLICLISLFQMHITYICMIFYIRSRLPFQTFRCILFMFTLSIIYCNAHAKAFIFEAEDSHTVGTLNLNNPEEGAVYRSEASGRKAVHLIQGQYLEYTFCVRQESNVQVSNIRFSNDGPHDEYIIEIDGNAVGSFQTGIQTGSGAAWNNYHSSGQVGQPVVLEAGSHKVKLTTVVSDQWGAEVDFITLDVDDRNLDEMGFYCDKFCFDDITFKNVSTQDSVPSSRFEQNSFKSSCSEEANVRVAVYNDIADTFRFTATIPKYITFSNNRVPIFSGCNFNRPSLNLSNILIDPYGQTINTKKMKTVFAGSPTYMIMTTTFYQSELSFVRGVDENRVGSILTIKFRNEGAVFDLDVSYLGESRRYISFDRLKIDPQNETTYSWTFPDYSWSANQENILRLGFSSSQTVNVVIDSLTLKSRETVHNKTILFKDNKYIIEGTDIDFWYMGENTMTITSKYTKEESYNMDRIQVYAKLPWSSEYSQVFSLYHDGLVSLLPMTPHGLDWIPFGTSIVIGPNNASDSRPTSPVKSIELDTINMKFDVEFIHGDHASLYIDAMHRETILTVKYNSVMHDRRLYPLMTLSSMWISDGNSLVDRISVNSDTERNIIGDWNTLYGLSAVLYRKCISSYNTMSPDLKLETIGKDMIV